MDDNTAPIMAAILMAGLMQGKDMDFPTHAKRAVQATRILLNALQTETK